ncbi:hypothetical protein AAC387_Pa07g2921 [Persea americana]
MSEDKAPFLNEQLSKRTSIFGLRLWVIVGICLGAAFVILLFIISLWLSSRRNRTRHKNSRRPLIPDVSRDIQEIRTDHQENAKPSSQFIPNPLPEPEPIAVIERQALLPPEEESPVGVHKIQVEIGKGRRISYPDHFFGGSLHGGGDSRLAEQVAMVVPEVSHLGWGHWYTLRELEASTNGFADENVIGEGGYGIVYKGVLEDNTQVAVKNLLNNRGQAEKEFKVEVETIGRVRHKNLVRLLGYCAEGAYRLMYLHEGLEPKVVHRDVKSSNILLDKQWNPKVSDFGLAKLLGSERSYVTTRVMGTFGYVAPEYASTGMLNERSDIYSFGILIMEIISGRNPVDYSRPPGQVNLVEWLKTMVSNRNSEGVLDPKMPDKPSSRALKRALLVALRCVDPDAQKRPKMGHVIHMLEVDDFPYRDDRRGGRDRGHTHCDGRQEQAKLLEKQPTESGDSSGYESSIHANKARWRK